MLTPIPTEQQFCMNQELLDPPQLTAAIGDYQGEELRFFLLIAGKKLFFAQRSYKAAILGVFTENCCPLKTAGISEK